MIKTIYDVPEHIFKTSYQNATIGHVLTPPKLALEMIETLPLDFIKSGIKILDPACKNGSFLFQLVIKQLDNGWLIKDIEKSLYTCDTLMASLNVAESGIKHIIRFPYQNSLIKINNLLYKYPSVEILYDNLIKTITKNKYINIRQFINELLLDRKNNWLIVKFEENLIEFIKKYEGLSKTESKLFGEVFTPQDLIEEMLDTLPADVWGNKDLKWLDPAVGIGNFPAAILNRLMDGLKDVIVDSDERRKHILEEMIYMGDISTKNLFLLYQLFDQNNEFKLNVFRGDFLSDKFDKQMVEWGLDGFDLVVGNPPYQSSTNGPKTKKIDKSFIIKGLKKLNKDGLLLFVSPKNNILFLNGVEVNQEKIDIRYNLLNVNVNGVEENFKDIGTDFCYYLVANNDKYEKTIINNNYSIYIMYNTILPYDMNKDKINIISKCLSYNNEWKLKKSRIEKELSDNGKNKIITKILSDDIEYKWTDLTHKDMFKPKVLFALYGNNYIIDYDNKLFSGRSYVPYILTENNNESENLINITKSKLFIFLIKCVDTMQYPFEFILKNIKKIDLSKYWTDQELYEYFNLTPEEIQLIEETIQEPTKKKKSKKK